MDMYLRVCQTRRNGALRTTQARARRRRAGARPRTGLAVRDLLLHELDSLPTVGCCRDNLRIVCGDRPAGRA